MQTLTTTPQVSIAERVKRIEELNLEPIMVKIMDKKEGEGWTLEQTLEAAKWYKRFLTLALKFPRNSIVPNNQLDTFWHYHILDTMKYEEDCHYALGFFLHHFPYFGMRGTQDAENLKSSFAETLILMEKEFGESLSNLANIFQQQNEAPICNNADCHGSGCTDAKCGGGSGGTDGKYERPSLATMNYN